LVVKKNSHPLFPTQTILLYLILYWTYGIALESKSRNYYCSTYPHGYESHAFNDSHVPGDFLFLTSIKEYLVDYSHAGLTLQEIFMIYPYYVSVTKFVDYFWEEMQQRLKSRYKCYLFSYEENM